MSVLSVWYDTSSQLFWYKLVFMIELLFAETLFVLKLKRRPYFVLRVVFVVALLLRFSLLVPVLDYSAWYNALMFFVMFAASVLAIKFCFDESWKSIVFCAIAGYTVQHVAFTFYSILGIVFDFATSDNVYVSDGVLSIFANASTFTAFVGCHFFVYFVLYIFFGSRIKQGEPLELKSLTLLWVVIVISLSNIALSSIVTYTCYEPFNRNAVLMLDAYNVFCCLLSMYIQFKLLVYRRLETELDVEKRLRRLESEQYAMSKENIRLINMKCHDLKHQIRTIGRGSVVDGEVLRQIEEAVSIYDGTFRTGNDALDIILTEKSLVANEQNVRLSCSVNCVPLTFMKESDIYVLFGNALDNALRAVNTLAEDKRVISLSVKRRGEMTSVDVRNWFDGELTWSGGLPQSTKQADGYHGYGMQSMREVVEKYGGELVIGTDNDVFSLNMLFLDSSLRNGD